MRLHVLTSTWVNGDSMGVFKGDAGHRCPRANRSSFRGCQGRLSTIDHGLEEVHRAGLEPAHPFVITRLTYSLVRLDVEGIAGAFTFQHFRLQARNVDVLDRVFPPWRSSLNAEMLAQPLRHDVLVRVRDSATQPEALSHRPAAGTQSGPSGRSRTASLRSPLGDRSRDTSGPSRRPTAR